MTDRHAVELIALSNPDAPLGIVSLPIPGDADYAVAVRGARSQSVPVGFWPRSEKAPGGPKRPRRSLVFFENGPGTRPVVDIEPEETGTEFGDTGWRVEVRTLEEINRHSDEQFWHYCKRTSEVRLTCGSREVGLTLGISNEFGLHRWQYVRAQKLWGGPLVDAYRIGGHIYTGDESPLTIKKLHEIGDIITCPDNTVSASIYLLVFANGTAQVTGHWINGRIYGAVGDQNGVPVVEMHGDVRLNLEPASHLRSDEQTKALTRTEDGGTLWQPVENTLITIRYLPKDGGVEEITIPASADGLVQGTARSVTWLMGVGDQEPSIGRFAAPPDWYAACCDLAPFPLQLQDGDFERLGRICAETLLRNSVSGSFTSGGVWRYLDEYGKGVTELSMDGNETRSLFLRAYRDSNPRFYDLAMRSAYFIADIAVDHSRDIIHYHGDLPTWRTYSLIYQRFSGLVHGYIETGDYYLLETAEAIARNYMSLHMQNWPREGIGRDADPLNGFLLLWDYTGDETYFEFAREFAHDVTLVIGEDGGWLCGAGVGPQMGCNALPGTAWNGGHLLNGFTEFVMREPSVPREWLETARRALRHLYDLLEQKHNGFHPASSGFLGRIHWYLACRLGDPDLIRRTRKLMDNVLQWEHNTEGGRPIFTGPSAHHMNNYADYLIFYEATKNTLPGMKNDG